MTTPARTAANRRNAQQSTGPKTPAGKARSRQNARTHGLAVPLAALPAFRDDVEALARVLAGETTDPVLRMAARQAAEAELDLRRIRAVKQDLINGAVAAQRARHQKATALAPRRVPPDDPEGLVAQVLVALAPELLRLDRYERRARSRRRTALRLLVCPG